MQHHCIASDLHRLSKHNEEVCLRTSERIIYILALLETEFCRMHTMWDTYLSYLCLARRVARVGIKDKYKYKEK